MHEYFEWARDLGALAILAVLAYQLPPLLRAMHRTLSRIEGFLISQGMDSETPPAHHRR